MNFSLVFLHQINIEMNTDLEGIKQMAINYGFKLAMAIGILIIGFWIAGIVAYAVKR